MSTCHTERYRIQRAQRQQAREAIDTCLSALDLEGQDARLSLITQVPRPDGEVVYLQVIVCDDERGCCCDDPSPAMSAFRAAIAMTLDAPPERHDSTVLHEGHPD